MTLHQCAAPSGQPWSYAGAEAHLLPLNFTQTIDWFVGQGFTPRFRATSGRLTLQHAHGGSVTVVRDRQLLIHIPRSGSVADVPTQWVFAASGPSLCACKTMKWTDEAGRPHRRWGPAIVGARADGYPMRRDYALHGQTIGAHRRGVAALDELVGQPQLLDLALRMCVGTSLSIPDAVQAARLALT